jgi:putative two-component system response regulator
MGSYLLEMTPKDIILIVDDEISIRLLVKQNLTSAGYTCLEAAGAAEASELFYQNRIALALLDINMPGKSGIELLDEIASGYPDTAVIMLTAITDNETCLDCMHRGASDYITKPFNPHELRVRVGQALEKRNLRLKNRNYQLHLEEMVEEQASRIRSSFFNAVTALAQALEAKDKYTAGHSQRVAEISTAIARQLGMNETRLGKIRTAALVHDIGKIGIVESVLNKASRLTEEELAMVRLHPETGERILQPITRDNEILAMVRHHHERYDGKGYPDGVKGDASKTDGIAFDWSIIGLADAFDAMNSDRPYRKALALEQSLQELNKGAGSQFDPAVVKAFMDSRMFKSG